MEDGIPEHLRSIFDKAELWLVRHGICTMRMWAKWKHQIVEDMCSELDVTNINIIPKRKSQP